MSTNHEPDVADQRDPRYYSGNASMLLAIASLFVWTPVLAAAGIGFGIIAIAHGGRLDSRKLRGEGWIGTVLAGLILIGWMLLLTFS